MSIAKFYALFRGMSNNIIVSIYLRRLALRKIIGTDVLTKKDRLKLFSDYWLVEDSTISLKNRPTKLTTQEKLAITEFKENVRKFNEIAIIADGQSFQDLAKHFSWLSSSVRSFYNTPSQFFKDYYGLKTVYNQRADYLKQFKISQLYDINTKGKWFSEVIDNIAPKMIFALIILSIIAALHYLFGVNIAIQI